MPKGYQSPGNVATHAARIALWWASISARLPYLSLPVRSRYGCSYEGLGHPAYSVRLAEGENVEPEKQ